MGTHSKYMEKIHDYLESTAKNAIAFYMREVNYHSSTMSISLGLRSVIFFTTLNTTIAIYSTVYHFLSSAINHCTN